MNPKDVFEAAEIFASQNASFKKDFDKTVVSLKEKLVKKMCGSKLDELRDFTKNGGATFVTNALGILPDPSTYTLAKKLDKHRPAIDGSSPKDLRHHLLELTLGKVQPANIVPPARTRSTQPTRAPRAQPKPRKVSDQQPLK